MAFIRTDFEKKLNAVFKKAATALLDSGLKGRINDKAVAAVTAFESKLHDIFSLKAACCEIFGCTEAEFDRYYDKIKKYNKIERTKKTARG
jgi:thiamine pyrophosphokinase